MVDQGQRLPVWFVFFDFLNVDNLRFQATRTPVRHPLRLLCFQSLIGKSLRFLGRVEVDVFISRENIEILQSIGRCGLFHLCLLELLEEFILKELQALHFEFILLFLEDVGDFGLVMLLL